MANNPSAPIKALIGTVVFGVSIFLTKMLIDQSYLSPYSTPVPLSNISASPSVLSSPLSTSKLLTNQATIQPGRFIKASELYTNKLTEFEQQIFSQTKWPDLAKFHSNDETRQIYLVDCKVDGTPSGVSLTPRITTIPNVPNVAAVTIGKFLREQLGGFPSTSEISSYATQSGIKFNHQDLGINGLRLNSNGTLEINFFDSVAAYGGGSARLECMRLALDFTVKQFPAIKDTKWCIEKYPTAENPCDLDFSP